MDPRVEKAISLIKSNLGNQLALTELAHSVNLSCSRLNRLFKIALGVSITTYIKSLRIKRAKRLLETTFLTVKEIGSQCGLRDGSHFVQNFKTVYGRTPRQYRLYYHRFQCGSDKAPASSHSIRHMNT
jgi:AraC family transcriptional regulator, L-arginine-responsive activator